ncbi:MAG: PQQ-binding-like beta-propeller repeat protein [Candidatus Nanopelagicales bacterium]
MGITRPASALTIAALAATGLIVTAAADSPGEEPAPTTSQGTQPGSPWPTMRHDLRNTGASPIVAEDPGTKPWSYPTGVGIFSTPVVSRDGTIYVGSADHTLYGLNRSGDAVWKYRTDGIIDTAPALLAPTKELGNTLVFGSGDEILRRVRTDPQVPDKDRTVWQLQAKPPAPGSPQLVSWWEGSPNVGDDGTIYQGNTGSYAYAITGDGQIKWATAAADAVWTVPAIDAAENTYWGSVDTRFFALNPDGQQLWQRTTLGYVTSSPALDTQGTLYQGSFDGALYALDKSSGSVKWTFPTRDHIYSSPALVENPDGTPQQVIVGSTDGVLYSVDPNGSLRWAYDTGSPIRSSPVVGKSPDGGWIAYVSNANGHIVAVNTDDGSRRWVYDATSDKPELATRNQLNSSPALSEDGVITGSQDGVIWFVPYDYCLRQDVRDRRCVPASDDLPNDGTHVYPVNVGGGVVTDGSPVTISPAGYFTGRLVVRKGGETVPARLVPSPDANALATVSPDVDATVSLSGDGRYVFVRPNSLLPPDTTFTVTVQGIATNGGPRLGNLPLGNGDLQAVKGSFQVRTGSDGTPWRPKVTPDAVQGLNLSRLAVPLPPMLTSVNQIGFDFYNWIGAPIRTDAKSTVIWFVGAKRQPDGTLVSDPEALFAFPVFGEQRGGTFSWSAQQVNLWFTFGPVPLRRFDLRGTFDAEGVVRPDAQFLAESVCADIPSYGTKMPITGMCDTDGVITAAGTYLGRTADSPALHRVKGLTVGKVTLADGRVSAPITLAPDVPYKKDDHFVSILLLDTATGRPVPIDYYQDTTMTTDADGTITGTSVTVPADLPDRVTAYVMTDAFPAATAELDGSSS